MYQAGGLFGSLFAGWMGDKLGRRKAMFVAAVIAVLGGALQAGSVHVAMFVSEVHHPSDHDVTVTNQL